MKKTTNENEIKQFEIKSKEAYVTKTFRMPESFMNEMSTLAQEKGISLNELVLQCCMYAIENIKKD